MYGPINVKSPNNIRKWQMGFNSAFKGLTVNKVKHSVAYGLTKLVMAGDNYVRRT
jgi:hypothetical protein